MTIKYSDCSVTLVSPPQFEECVVEIEHGERLLMRMADEQRTGEMVVVVVDEAENKCFEMPLTDLARSGRRAILCCRERKGSERGQAYQAAEHQPGLSRDSPASGSAQVQVA